MHICIAGTFSYPDGCGASARMYSYAMGFLSNGVKVSIIPFEKETRDIRVHAVNKQSTQSEVAVYYQRVNIKTSGNAKGFFTSRFLVYQEIKKFNRQIREIHANEPITALILVGRSLVILLPIIRNCKRMGIKVIHEKSEYPFVTDKKTLMRRAYYEMYNSTVYKMFDGLIAITTTLKDYFDKRIGDETRVLRVPILVDDTREDFTYKLKHSRTRTILYVGNLEHEEEIVTLLNSFSTIFKKNPDWMLNIVGDTTSESRNNLYQTIVQDQMMESSVVFHGRLSRTEIPLMLANADIMALPRASGQFSTAGFPTKLGEYLLSGKPVVVTATGDIPKYLTNGVDAYLVKPGDQSMFTKTLIKVIDNYKKAEVVGRRGRETALREFSCVKHGARIMKFIRKL